MPSRTFIPRLAPLLLVCAAAIFPVTDVPAATLVVANKAEATVSLIDLGSGAVVATLPTGEGPHEVDVSPDGRLALVTNYGTRGSDGNTLTLIDIPAAAVAGTIDLGEYGSPHGVEWLDEARAAITAEDDQALLVVDVTAGRIAQSIETGQKVSHMVALHPDGRRAYTSNMGSGSISVIDLAEGRRDRVVTTGAGAEGIAVAASGRHVWVTNREDDTLSVLDAETFETVREIPCPGFPIRATATPGGQILVTRARAGDLVIYDAATFDEVRTVAFDLEAMEVEERLFGDRFGDSSVPIGVIVDDGGEHAFVAHANADVITEIDLASGEIVRTLRAGREPDGMGYSRRSADGIRK